MQVVRRTGAALAVLALTLFAAGSAFAQSTDLYPASDTISMGSAPMFVGGPVCTFHGGSVVAPAKGSSGAVTLRYKEQPSFTECSSGASVEVAGEWTISFEYGTAAGKISIPLEGLTVRNAKHELVYFNSKGPMTLSVGWNNGFSSPVTVGSQLEVYGSPEMYSVAAGKYQPIPFTPSLVSLTDTTHPTSMPVLGP